MDTELAIRDLKLIKKVFDKFKVPFFLAYGTCLGAYRDKDFLPGDKDIDLGVIEPIDLKTRKEIGWALYDLGFKTQEILFRVFERMEPVELGYNGDHETGIIVCEKNVDITIFFYKPDKCEEHGDVFVCIPKLGGVKLIETPAKFYDKLSTIKFKGEKFLVPSPTEDYLAFTYQDWKDKLMRDHGKTYVEMHIKDYLKNVPKNNEAAIIHRGTQRDFSNPYSKK